MAYTKEEEARRRANIKRITGLLDTNNKAFKEAQNKKEEAILNEKYSSLFLESRHDWQWIIDNKPMDEKLKAELIKQVEQGTLEYLKYFGNKAIN